MEALKRRFTDPHLHVKRARSLKFCKRYRKGYPWKFLIVNYFTDKYGDLKQPQKNRVKLSILQKFPLDFKTLKTGGYNGK